MIRNYMADREETSRDIETYPALIKRIRETFIEATEGLAKRAV
jgi:hypothetical protein